MNMKLFFYDGNSVTFKNGVVESYNNSDGNLKIRINPPNKKSKSNSAKKQPKSEKQNKTVKWLYYTFMTTDIQISVDPISGELKDRTYEHSFIYSISGYTYEKQQTLEYCLTKKFKEWNGKQVYLKVHKFDNRETALISWNAEKGSLFRSIPCNFMHQGIYAN